MTYYDRLSDFFKFIELKRLPAHAQLVALHVLQINNRLGNTGQLVTSYETLEYRTRLSREQVIDGFRILKSHNWLSTRRTRDEIIVRLLTVDKPKVLARGDSSCPSPKIDKEKDAPARQQKTQAAAQETERIQSTCYDGMTLAQMLEARRREREQEGGNSPT